MSIILREPGVSKDNFKGSTYEVKLEPLEGQGEWGFINQETFMAKGWIYHVHDVFRNNAMKKL